MADISVPSGGGAISGIGETFQPDLQTGTANLSVPLPLPPGRGATTPSLALAYSSGAGNGPFGLGWTLAVPRISRRTDRGVPIYDDAADVFVLSGSEELAPVPLGNATPADLPAGAVGTRYRPRTESGFARIVHVVGPQDDYWEVWSGNGLRNRYGTARPAGAAPDWVDPAAVRTPDGKVFGWLLSRTTDSLGNVVAYDYRGDGGAQRYLDTVSYADYGDPAAPSYAVTVTVVYGDAPRPDPFSERRGGFELRTTLRASRIEITTVGQPGTPSTVVDLGYADQAPGGGPAGGLSLLSSIRITGQDAASGQTQSLPPLSFDYRPWNPEARRFRKLPDTLPPTPLGPGFDLVDLFGDGLPSVLELDGGAQYWRNRGGGRIDAARALLAAPSGATLGMPGVQFGDVDADGRPELTVTAGGRTTVWPLAAPRPGSGQAGFAGTQQITRAVPTTEPGSPQVRILDLDGDHIPDLLIAGAHPLLAPGDGQGGFGRPQRIQGAPPLGDLADPHIQLVDMTGDGLVDVVEIHDGAVRYWPNLGHGRFGLPIQMAAAPRFADAAGYGSAGFDPRRLLLGDMTGDGTADVVYVADGQITVWTNMSGNGFAPPVAVRGTPGVDDRSSVRLADVDGIGVSGVLWSGLGSRGEWAFLDLTGGAKPYLLTAVDNHCGARTELRWSTSTAFAVADSSAGRAWRTTLPFPVHVVAGTRSTDWFSGTVLTSGFSYHEGYWDAGDREFRGFGRVEQRDVLVPVAPMGPLGRADPLDPLTPVSALPDGFDAAVHGNLLSGWSFDQPGHTGPATLTTTAAHPVGTADSAAAGWQIDNGTAATTVTELLSSDLPQGRGGSMLHVTTDGAQCGVARQLPPGATGPHGLTGSVWIKLVRGSVVLDVAGGGDVSLRQVGGWYLVTGGSPAAGTGRVAIRAGSGGAEFYLDHAWVAAADVPAEPLDGPPTRRVTWFHLGPVGPAQGAWTELPEVEYSWAGDESLAPAVDRSLLPSGIPRAALREALRALRGRILRSELYSDDGDPDRGDRPYEVHENRYQVAPVLDGRTATDPTWTAAPVITVHDVLTRTTTWERGDDPLTRLTATGGHDGFGRPAVRVELGVPRGRDPRVAGDACLGTVTTTTWATRDDATLFRLDRVASSTRHEAVDPGTSSALDFAVGALGGQSSGQLLGLQVHHYDGEAFIGLPLGELGAHGLEVRTEQLVVTPERLAAIGQAAAPGGGTAAVPPYLPVTGGQPPADWGPDYPPAFRDGVLSAPPARGQNIGYLWHDADGPLVAGWYAATSRLAYDVQTPVPGRRPRGLTLVSRDPVGGDRTTTYEPMDLQPASVTDPVGLATTAEYDTRLFKPVLVTDPNGNRTAIGYTPLGMPAWVAAIGKAGAQEGDTVQQPGQVFSYDLSAWDASIAAGGLPQPMSVTTIRRTEHRWSLVASENARRAAAGLPPLDDAGISAMFGPTETVDHPERFVRTVEFSDGFGRPLQTRTQADSLAVGDVGLPDDLGAASRSLSPDPVPSRTPVVVSRWTRYDARGRAVVSYEPFRDVDWPYAPPSPDRLGGMASSQQHYDVLGRPVVSVAADGSRKRIVHGVPRDVAQPWAVDPSPWERWTYDADDEAGRSAPTNCLELSRQWDTPTSTVIDALGRTTRSVQRGLAEDVVTTTKYDVDGHLIAATDPLGRLAATNVYDYLGRAWTHWLLDSGTTRTVHDPAGGIVEQRDDRGARRFTAFDAGHRTVRVWAAERSGDAPTLREVTVFGDDEAESGLSPTAAAAANLRGHMVACYDEAGRLTASSYDLGAHATRTTRQVIRPDLLLSGLPAPGTGSWTDTAYRVDWQPPPGATLSGHAQGLLDGTPYATDTSFDALGRRTSTVAPVDVTGSRAVVTFRYDRGGGVSGLAVDGVPYLSQVVYDAHGRRSLAVLGNGVLVRYRYDPRSLRLRRVRAEHVSVTASGWTCDGPVLRDTSHRYSPAGSLLVMGERAPGCGVPPGNPDALNRRFDYDALGRLVRADGRETDVAPAPPWADRPRSSDPTRSRAYTETYLYDLVGNLLGLSHATDTSGTGAYTRTSRLGTGNRLASVTVGTTTYAYAHDARGNLLREADNRFLEWDHADRLITFRDQAGPQPSVYGQYRYDSAGQRVLKVVRRSSGPDFVTVYVGGFERILRGVVGGAMTPYDDIRLTDSQAALAAIRRGPALPDDPMGAHPATYQLTDHLGSVTATLAEDGTLLDREEYLPYGETSFGSYARKRYRFTAKERDEESGLAYHGARYYAPWLARWTAPDPATSQPSQSPYSYVADRPLDLHDPTGLAGEQSAPMCSNPPTNNVMDVAHFEVRQAAFEAGPTSQANARAKGMDPLSSDPAVRTRLSGQQGQDVMNVLKSNLEAHAKDNTFPGGSRKLIPELHIEDQVVQSAGGNPKPSGRNPDLGIAKEEIPGKDPKAEWNELAGKRAPDVLEPTTLDVKVGGGYVRDKAGFEVETGLKASEIRPFSRGGGRGARGSITLELSLSTAVGVPLLVYGVYQTGQHMTDAYHESQRTGSSLPVIEQGAREAGGWGGGFAGGYALGALVGVETGPGALLTGLIGGLIGGTAGYMGVDLGISGLHSLANDLSAGFDAFIKPMYTPSPSPWGGW